MKVQLLVSKNDFALRGLLKECMENSIPYDLAYMEDNPELVDAYKVTSSPNIIVNGEMTNAHTIDEIFEDYLEPIK